MRRLAAFSVIVLAVAACGQSDDTTPSAVGTPSVVTVAAPPAESVVESGTAMPTTTTEPESTPPPPTEPVIVAATEAVCAELAQTGIVDGASRATEQQATLLLDCMMAASAPEQAEQLAGLQLAFLVDQPAHPEAAAVSAALSANFGACELRDRIRTSIPAPTGETLYVETTFTCAQFADFVGDTSGAVDLYQAFIAAAPGDTRVPEAQTKLARNMIAEARASGAQEFDPLEPSGSSGSDLAQLVLWNDTAYEQQLVITGSETRFVTVPASPTSSTYTAPPLTCATDVPSVTLDLVPGTYDLLLSDDVETMVATWQLDQGTAYEWCVFYVRVF